jgi:hypothetical protein
MASPSLTPISDVELDELLAAGPVDQALASRRLTVAQALRVLERQPGPFPVGRIDRPPDVTRPFFDPRTIDDPPEIVLQRVVEDGNEKFRLRTRIGYSDAELGAFIVPADGEKFDSDLTSVPTMFTWLVPQTGRHLPAALVHDGMILGRRETATYLGPKVDRVTADRIFRDGMKVLETSIIRRWLVWTAVAVASAWAHPSAVRRWMWRLVIALTVVVIVGLGGLATVDFFDCRDALPWMWKDTPWGLELLWGGLMAVAVPVVLAMVLWWGQRRAGIIFGVALAFVLHVTLALVVLVSLYTLAELIVRPRGARHVRSGGRLREFVLAIGGIVFAGVGPIFFLWWACH